MFFESKPLIFLCWRSAKCCLWPWPLNTWPWNVIRVMWTFPEIGEMPPTVLICLTLTLTFHLVTSQSNQLIFAQKLHWTFKFGELPQVIHKKNKDKDIPYLRPVSPTLCLRDLDPHLSRFRIPRGIPHEMPTSNPQDILSAIRTQRRSARSNRLVFNLRHHQPQRHLHLRAHRQTTGQRPSPQGISCSCQLVSWSTPRLLLETQTWTTTWQVARPDPEGHRLDSCWSLETGTKARPSTWRRDATAHDGYSMMMIRKISFLQTFSIWSWMHGHPDTIQTVAQAS